MNYSEQVELAKKFDMYEKNDGLYWYINPFKVEPETDEAKEAQRILVDEVIATREQRLEDAIKNCNDAFFAKAIRSFVFFYNTCKDHGYQPKTKFEPVMDLFKTIVGLKRISAARLLEAKRKTLYILGK
jgi:hypothetical protein